MWKRSIAWDNIAESLQVAVRTRCLFCRCCAHIQHHQISQPTWNLDVYSCSISWPKFQLLRMRWWRFHYQSRLSFFLSRTRLFAFTCGVRFNWRMTSSGVMKFGDWVGAACVLAVREQKTHLRRMCGEWVAVSAPRLLNAKSAKWVIYYNSAFFLTWKSN